MKHITKKFPKETLKFILDDDEAEFEGLPLEQISDKISDHSRWNVGYTLIFSHGPKFYLTYYQVGATENQEERPWEYDGAEIECYEVEPRQVTHMEYILVQAPVTPV